MAHVHLILGDQLFPSEAFARFTGPTFMAEDRELCTHFRYHKHKLVFFLASMRHFRDEEQARGLSIDYSQLDDPAAELPFLERLEIWLKAQRASALTCYEVDDRFFAERLRALCAKLQVALTELPSPKFLTSRPEFKTHLARVKKPFMKTFYEERRRHSKLLMDEKGKPIGGKYSFDADNRKRLPKGTTPPPVPRLSPSGHVTDVAALVERLFPDHPGDTKNFWPAVTRADAKKLAGDFFQHRLALFGDYEDALDPNSDFLFHSVLSPYMNIGFLPPAVLMAQVPKLVEKTAPLNSLEGFVRQVIGWREFIRGIYDNFDETQQRSNFFHHQRKLTRAWYEGTTGIPVLDDSIRKAQRLGYCHHIERLMVLSNLMLLSEIHPQEVYRWFMEMFVDSADWVMGPNVFGMAQFADGGIFATKPYVCGSNYIRKMSHYPEGPWCDVMDGLYWRFMGKHRDFFAKNMRMGAALGTLDKMDPARRERIFAAAEDFLATTTKA